MAKAVKKTEDKPKEVKQAEIKTQNFASIQGLVKDMNKHYGKPLLRTGNGIPYIFKVPYKEPALDYVTDGGVAIGRVQESLGHEHTGKTRNALRALSQFQKYCFGCNSYDALDVVWEYNPTTDERYTTKCECKFCDAPETRISLFVDIEGTTDPLFMEMLDVDTKGVYYARIDLPSQAVDIVDAFLRQPSVGLIIVDSVGSMGSDAETEKAMEDIKMNQNALFLNRAVRKWQMALNSNSNTTGKENGATMIVINQSYQSLDLMSKEIAQGGRGLRHGKGQSIKNSLVTKTVDPKTKEVKGVQIRATNEKNKTGMPYRRMEYYLNLDSNDPEIRYAHTNINMQYVELAIMLELVEQRGAWFFYGNSKWNGKAAIVADLTQDVKDAVDEYLYTTNKLAKDATGK